MAREQLSSSVEYERTDYGFEIYRPDMDENIKLTNGEVKRLKEEL